MDTKGLEAAALSIRSLSMDAIEKAASGHPGLPLGAAELGALLYGEILRHNPKDSKWANRDRFVLSAGHGSMLLYAALHLAGYKITLDDIKSFRGLDSVCSGHPEYGLTDGVENTSGPLGQGIALAVGLAIGETMLAAIYNTPRYKIVDHYTYTLVGEGCLEEGVASEAASLAGHLKLNKLIAFYDQNKISIDGCTDLTFTEDIAGRFRAYGWQVFTGDMYDMEGIMALVNEAKKSTSGPSLIMLKSIIGKGSPKAGSAKVHGEPLGKEALVATKIALGLDPTKSFYVDPYAYEYYKKQALRGEEAQRLWEEDFRAWGKENPKLLEAWQKGESLELVCGKAGNSPDPIYETGQSVSTRAASQTMLNIMSLRYPYLVGGSADLKGSNKTKVECDNGTYSASNRKGRSIEYGVREFGMACITAGIALHGGLRAFAATYLVFSDYMKAAMRLTCIMKLPVIYILTHDSIYVGEDGSTHQPIEQLAALRSIPNMAVLRPGDAQETAEAWHMAMENTNYPVALVLTRQNVPVYKKEDPKWQETIRRGAYIVKTGGAKPKVTIVATGSEVNLSLLAAAKSSVPTRVVSVLDKGLFDRQEEAFRQSILGADRLIVVEAGVKEGWEGYVKDAKDLITIDSFGTSAPGAIVAKHLGLTVEHIMERIEA